MHLQGTLIVDSLSLFVRSLGDVDPVVMESMEALGRRHVAYGVVYSDYDGVGEALFWTLEQLLGRAFTREMRAAWVEAYRTLASTMRQASSGVL